jgi:hypothetical protein
LAPAGAVEARLVFVYAHAGNQAGAVLVDDVSFSVVAPLAGDFNLDGVVDAADYTVWRDGQSTDSGPAGYALWAGNFGAMMAANSTSVPEPSAFASLITAIGATVSRYFR